MPDTSYQKQWCRDNKDKVRGYRAKTLKKFREKHGVGLTTAWKRNNPEKAMWHSAKERAKKNGVPFNIDVSDIVIPDVCPVLGVPIVIGVSRHPHSPSLDRITNKLGYVKGNVAVISMAANSMKSNLDIDTIHSLLRYMGSWVEVVPGWTVLQ